MLKGHPVSGFLQRLGWLVHDPSQHWMSGQVFHEGQGDWEQPVGQRKELFVQLVRKISGFI